VTAKKECCFANEEFLQRIMNNFQGRCVIKRFEWDFFANIGRFYGAGGSK
jgi:hypothetical protein